MSTTIQTLRHLEFETNAVLFRPYLERLAQSLTHNRYDADDLVQETLTRAYRFRSRFTPGTNMRAWLTRILKNSFINTRRLAARNRSSRGCSPIASRTFSPGWRSRTARPSCSISEIGPTGRSRVSWEFRSGR
jgi:RNA polymerase sigma factor (sigma-70 family)